MKAPYFSIIYVDWRELAWPGIFNCFRSNDLNSFKEGEEVAAALRRFLRSVVERDALASEEGG